MNIAHINTNGLNQISDALNKHHKLGGRDHFTHKMLLAWAEVAQQSFDEDGKDMFFEIKSSESISGHTQLITITEDGYDIEIL